MGAFARCNRPSNKRATGRFELTKPKNTLTFVDVFAGCGGLSLGLMNAGWTGAFAIEADRLAFATLRANLLSTTRRSTYNWPTWLPQEPAEIRSFIETYQTRLKSLAGKIDLIAGGPPCQGFSTAGRRNKSDPRNQLFLQYVKMVELVRPPLLLFENVRGVTVEFRDKGSDSSRGRGRRSTPFATKIQDTLTNSGYRVFPRLVRAVDFGVPQLRPRYIMLAASEDILANLPDYDPFDRLEQVRLAFLKRKKLPIDRPVGAREAISDLEIRGRALIDCDDVPGYRQVDYQKPETTYQQLLHGAMNGTSPNSMRLAKHHEEIRLRFESILKECRRGVHLNEADRIRYGIRKKCIVPMAPEQPSHTLTSLPDDLIHYSEPRILSVREYARLQSFPDWFEFHGKYTTGGSLRVKECPRYTQVANAVPPFLSEVLGTLLANAASDLGIHR